MARSKKAPEWTPDAIEAFLQNQAASQAAGKGFLVSSDGAAADIGIRLPHFCLRYVYHRTTLPFERTTILYGPTGSNKSSFLFWLYWLFRTGGGKWPTPHGKYLHLGVEDKDSPLLRLSLTDYDDSAGWVKECASLNEFQEQVKTFLDWFKSFMSKGPGRRIPLMIGVDSLVAKMTTEAAKVVDKSHGETGRRFADEARALKDWYMYMPNMLRSWPVHLVGVNHDKPKPGEHGRPEQHHTPGGASPNYYATYKILLQRVKKLDETASGWQGNRIKFKMEKNSLGSDSYVMEANIIWRAVRRPNAKGDLVPAQQTLWDFPRASTELLYQMAHVTKDKKPATAAAVRELIGIDRLGGGRYYAPGLGVSKDSPLSAYDFGLHMELPEQAEVMKAFEERLGIVQCREHQIGVDLLDQQGEARTEIENSLPASGTEFVDWGDESSIDESDEDGEDGEAVES